MNFSELPSHSRIWIYQSNVALDAVREEQIRSRADVFLAEWTSHQNRMHAALEVFYNRFVVIGVDEQSAPASGCGIDKSVRFIRDLGRDLNLELLDRMQIAWKDAGQIKTSGPGEFENLIISRKLNGNTVVFNNLIETKAQLETAWCVPVTSSWHSRYLPKD